VSIIYALMRKRKRIEEERHFSAIKTNDAARSVLKYMGVEIGTLVLILMKKPLHYCKKPCWYDRFALGF